MRSFVALLNPIAGDRTAADRWSAVAAELTAAGAVTRAQHTRSRAHAVELAEQASRNGDVVVAVGGDGLVRDVAGGCVAARGPMGIVPAGRGNDFATTLGWPTDPRRLAGQLLDGPLRSVDVLDADGVIVVGNVYAGIDSAANRIINDNRWLPGLLVYRLAPVLAMATWSSPRYEVTVDGRRSAGRAFTVVVANAGTYGHGLRIVPQAVVNDGQLDVLAVGHGRRTALPAFMAQATDGRHLGRREVSADTGTEVTIATDRAVPLFGDGDEIGSLPVTVRLRRSALILTSPH